MKRKFYRLSNIVTGQGLWYNTNGIFTGLIHNEFSFCQNHKLQMDFDDELTGYLSAVPSIKDLFAWFTPEDIKRLEPYDYFIHEYESDDFFFYQKFQHFVISQENSTLIRPISLEEYSDTCAPAFNS